MTILNSFLAGLSRVARSLALLIWLYLALVVVSFPLALGMRAILQKAIGDSLVHESLRRGFDIGWHGEFSSRTAGWPIRLALKSSVFCLRSRTSKGSWTVNCS